MDECRIEGCGKPLLVKAARLCKKHYTAWKRYGDPLVSKRKPRQSCQVDGCELLVVGQGLCDKHYRRQRRYGTPTPPERPTVCTMDGCDRDVQAHGLCDMHYRRQRSGREDGRLCLYCGEPIPAGEKGRRTYCCREHYQLASRDMAAMQYRDTWLRRYGINSVGYDALLAEQGGGCAICGDTDPKGRAKSPYFHVDHDHGTGQVRGLLCSFCNNGLGHFRDDPAILQKAIGYLALHGASA